MTHPAKAPLDETNVWRLEGHGATVSIEFCNYENRDSENCWDAKWLTCVISVDAMGFSGASEITVLTGEIEALYKELSDLLYNKKILHFKNLEEDFAFTSTEDFLGNIMIAGELKNSHNNLIKLSFNLAIDRNSLENSVFLLKKIIDKILG